ILQRGPPRRPCGEPRDHAPLRAAGAGFHLLRSAQSATPMMTEERIGSPSCRADQKYVSLHTHRETRPQAVPPALPALRSQYRCKQTSHPEPAPEFPQKPCDTPSASLPTASNDPVPEPALSSAPATAGS